MFDLVFKARFEVGLKWYTLLPRLAGALRDDANTTDQVRLARLGPTAGADIFFYGARRPMGTLLAARSHHGLCGITPERLRSREPQARYEAGQEVATTSDQRPYGFRVDLFDRPDAALGWMYSLGRWPSAAAAFPNARAYLDSLPKDSWVTLHPDMKPLVWNYGSTQWRQLNLSKAFCGDSESTLTETLVYAPTLTPRALSCPVHSLATCARIASCSGMPTYCRGSTRGRAAGGQPTGPSILQCATSNIRALV